MRVAIFNGAGKPVTIEDRPDHDMGPGDVRISIERAGICGSDISMSTGSAFDFATGSRLGHEFAGEVIEVGREVSDIRIGDRLAVLPSGPCGACAMCRAQLPMFCMNGRHLFGGFGERMVLPPSSARLLPRSVSMAEGALVEPIACGRRALRMAGMKGGEKILVLGAGNMAISVVYWGRLMGAGRIVVASRSARRDDSVMAMGAHACVRLDDDNPGAIERALGGPPDIVAECIGKPGMLQLAIDKARIGSQIISMGMCTVADPVVPAANAFREVSLHFPIAYSFEDFTETIRAFDTGAMNPEAIVSTTIALDELPAMLEEMRGPHQHLKVQVDPHRTCSHG